MPLETWFPLVIYYADLEGAGKYNTQLTDTILELEKTAIERRSKNTAWTGDVHGVGRIHDDPRFIWIVEQVEQHCIEYLKALGHDMTKIDLFIQRSWPVIARKNEGVSAHAHHNANISAVYYASVPKTEKGEDAGAFVIHNEANQNELQSGISSSRTGAIKNWNDYNYKQGIYYPKPGRLLMFPSKQRHSVDAHQSDELRISMSFDIVMTSSRKVKDSVHEFLSPPPDRWRAFSSSSSENT